MIETRLAAEFEPATREQWLKLVDKVLKGADFERRLVSRTADGIGIAPLYTRADAIPELQDAVPGAGPFTRGHLRRVGAATWHIRQIHAEPDPDRTNRAILEDLAGGATSIHLQIAAPGWSGLAYTGEAMARALADVRLEACPVSLLAGEYTLDAAGSLTALWRAQDIPADKRRGAFNADPLGTLALTGALYHPLDRSLEIAARLAADALDMPGVTALGADGHIYHSGGASEAQELAFVLATVVAYLRALEAAGVAPAQALPKIAVTLAVDADQFLGLAKLRAARRLLWRVAEACGAGGAVQHVPLTAETSYRMMARRDPWVNMLRTTVACAAAAMGGADAITVLPFTWALGRPDAFARRIARNTHLVLQEESGLGRVLDPAGGSWYVERLTDDLARAAWALFQKIEATGGMGIAVVSGVVQEQIAVVAAARAESIATGEEQLIGISAFPLLGDDGVKVEPWPTDVPSADLNGQRVTPLKIVRSSEPFEALRDRADAYAARTGRPPQVFLVNLDSDAEHAARATWARTFFAAGGFASVDEKDTGRGFARSGAAIACLCGSDAAYAEIGADVARALKRAGARYVLVAGRPRSLEDALRAAGVDELLASGCDVVATLSKLQELLDA